MEKAKEGMVPNKAWRQFVKDYAPLIVGLLAVGVAAWGGKFQVDSSLKIAKDQDALARSGWLASSLQASRTDKFETMYIELAQLDSAFSDLISAHSNKSSQAIIDSLFIRFNDETIKANASSEAYLGVAPDDDGEIDLVNKISKTILQTRDLPPTSTWKEGDWTSFGVIGSTLDDQANEFRDLVRKSIGLKPLAKPR
jgi:hypothetical protein